MTTKKIEIDTSRVADSLQETFDRVSKMDPVILREMFKAEFGPASVDLLSHLADRAVYGTTGKAQLTTTDIVRGAMFTGILMGVRLKGVLK